MIIKLTENNFFLENGNYYSAPFKLFTDDNYMSISSTLVDDGEVYLERSLDGIDWYLVADSTFNCTPSGLQSYSDCQPEIQFRLGSTTEFIKANILL